MSAVEALSSLLEKYGPKTYDLLACNCNHFCQDFATALLLSSITRSKVPKYVNRLARVGHRLARILRFFFGNSSSSRVDSFASVFVGGEGADDVKNWGKSEEPTAPLTTPKHGGLEKARRKVVAGCIVIGMCCFGLRGKGRHI